MFSHIMVGSNDLDRSKKFYDATFAAFGGPEGKVDPKGRLVYAHNGAVFLVTKPIDGEAAGCGNGMTIGFGMTPEHPHFAEMREEGATDYIALPLSMSDGTIHAMSCITRHPEGFTETQLADLRLLMPALTRMIEVWLLRRTAAGLLDNYVGARAGARILAGQIRRGHTESMHAAIWLSDLRGFTPLSDRLSPEAVVDVLNTYFDCQVPAILNHGGEVLKFMGDGLLAVFPISDREGDTETVCRRVLEAARECRASVGAMTYAYGSETLQDFRFGLALHIGKVLYGNIGGGDRLDFTCIGPAVNLAVRIESLAAKLAAPVAMSKAFADVIRESRKVASLGRHPVKGLMVPPEVFALAPALEAPAATAA